MTENGEMALTSVAMSTNLTVQRRYGPRIAALVDAWRRRYLPS